ncbi:STY0301 family protein [Caballeronia sp. NK8]|uniref:STY0301 family protein n=1 Tax=Caballeronia sp. NK8 TaxID=140098 RepID=UPI001BD0FBC5|nr:STY0301 family protein [Caballeronia sp. NK8]
MTDLLPRTIRMAVCLCVLTAPCFALAVEIQCPARIDMEPVVVKNVPEGWRPSQTNTSVPVWGVGINVGPPEEGMVLKPQIYKVRGRQTFNWPFIPADSEKGIWLSCVNGTVPVALAQELPKGISKCIAKEPIPEEGWKVVTVCR